MQQTANSITEQVIAEVNKTMLAEKTNMFDKLEATEKSIINAVSSMSSSDTGDEYSGTSTQTAPIANATTSDAIVLKILEMLKEMQQDMK